MSALEDCKMEPPVRIILQFQPDIQKGSESKLRASIHTVVKAFFDQTKPQKLNCECTHVHLPVTGDIFGSRVIVDACTGKIPAGSASESIPLAIYIVSQKNGGLSFEKAKASSFIVERIRSETDRIPWKAQIFIQQPINAVTRKSNELLATSQLERDARRKGGQGGQSLQRLEMAIEAKLRLNIAGTDPGREAAIQPEPAIHDTPVSHIPLSDLPIRLLERPIRVFLLAPTDDTVGDLRKRSTMAVKTFLKCMMGDEYQRTKTAYLVRAMSIIVQNKQETWMLIDYWIGLSKGTRNPPLLTMAYRGILHDGQMKFQPTEVDKANHSMFLTKFRFAMKGTAITIEGTEPTARKATSTEAELTQTPPTTLKSGFSDNMPTGDWVLPICEAGSGLSSWEFITPE
ncbi:uncharacterized protein N7503_001744 [Penicillium pulvis]|uniref:uncharacterized protein n=1 Tax=Penicillium pulvis TaxID=1562058 RepID=UPI002548794E|nr:uncharacterized protein N7503_001744 [Penicillium pulvis]KAJ5809526.1 hypothetical protein N7503_001744 [Penicillium pulvis]